MRFLQKLYARPLIGWWLTTNGHSWHRRVVANDSPHVHAPGTNPDRVLIAGDGAATGRGVRTHDLGLPGYLARSLTSHTGRATDVDIVVRADMTARSCQPALSEVDLGQFDIVVLSLGANEALALTSVSTWRDALRELISDVLDRAPVATKIFLLPVPSFGINPHFPGYLARVVDRHVRDLNAATDALISDLPRVEVIAVEQAQSFEEEGPHVYQLWAAGIAVRISNALDPDRVSVGSTERQDEAARQDALAQLATISVAPEVVDLELEAFAERARQAFGTAIAAVTLIQSDVQVMKAASGITPMVLPRDEAFCDITIRRASHFVIDDASLDFRYKDYAIVKGDPKVKFYAGYPIESPNGQRVGAVCVMDTEPRTFSAHDAEILRTYALTVQKYLWRNFDS